MDIRLLDLSGSPADIGVQHGRALGSEIHECLKIYQEVIGRSFAELSIRADAIAEDIRQFAPAVAEEIEAIAQGAEVDSNFIYLLNARSELMSTADGCTAVYSPEINILGQTWDWIERIEPLFALLRIERSNGDRILTMTEPGMVGKIGLNSAGIGCTLNFLYSPGQHLGTPVHVLLRGILESPSIDSAQQTIARRTPGQSGNLMIGSKSSQGLNIELGGLSLSTENLGNKTFSHTNHHLNNDISAGTLAENSHARLKTANGFIDRAGLCGLSDVKELLSDTSNTDNPICAPYSPALGTQIGTVCTVVMELAAGLLHIRKGPNPDASFHTVSLNT